jgi:hypothetical protein
MFGSALRADETAEDFSYGGGVEAFSANTTA